MHFIGNFQYLTNQENQNETDRRHGGFSMMVQADSTAGALEKFRRRLLVFRETSNLFEGHCTIFVTQLLEFDHVPEEEAILLNFKSFMGDPLLPHIACVVPTEQSDACTIHEWQNNQPLTEWQEDSLFLEFV